MTSSQMSKVLGYAIFCVLMAYIHAETCEQFIEPTLKSTNCVRSSLEVPVCYFELRDQDCGMGYAFIDFFNCTSEGIKCCRPCSRKVIHDSSCSAAYCVYGRLSPGQIYKADTNCEYVSGEWSVCHTDLLMRQRTDQLVKARSASNCKSTNVIEKVCDPTDVTAGAGYPSSSIIDSIRKEVQDSPKINGPSKPNGQPNLTTPKVKNIVNEKKCSYITTSTWSSCDPQTRKRALRKQLDQQKSSPGCKRKKIEERSCFTKTGKERCFYTKWSRWSQCKNFIQRRERDILYGKSVDCNRTVKIRACQPDGKDQLYQRHKSKKSKKG